MRCRVDFGFSIPAGLYRLDARFGLRPDVSDPLLRLLAHSQPAPKQILHVLATWRHIPRSFIFISCRNLVCSRHRETVEQKSCPRTNRPYHHPSRRGNLRLRPALSPAGIRRRLGLGAVQRSVARGYPQHHRPVHDAHGRFVLVRAYRSEEVRKQSPH